MCPSLLTFMLLKLDLFEPNLFEFLEWIFKEKCKCNIHIAFLKWSEDGQGQVLAGALLTVWAYHYSTHSLYYQLQIYTRISYSSALQSTIYLLILSHVSAFILSQPLLFKSFQDANIHWSMCLSFKVPPSSCLSPTFIKRTLNTSTRLMGSAPTRRSTRRTWTCSRYDIMYLLSQQISHVEGICVRPWSIGLRSLWPFLSLRMVVLTHSNSSSCFCLSWWFFCIILVRQHH